MSNENLTSVIESCGVKATSFDETLKAARFNFSVKEDKVRGVKSGAVIKGLKMLYRSDNRQPLGVVGDSYVPTDPKKFLETQYEFAQNSGGSVVRAGWTGRGSRAFAIVKLGLAIDFPKAIRQKGDPMNVYIYSTDSWDGSVSRVSSLYIERLACLNGMMRKELSASIGVSHRGDHQARFETGLKPFLSEIAEKSETARNQFIKLAQERMSESEVSEFLKKLFPGEAKQTGDRRNNVAALFTGGIGNEGATRWDAFNAVTQFVTHREYRDSKTAKSDTNRFLNVLERSTINDRAMSLLLN